jgi:excisionase family DNA binding protein
MSRRKAPVVPLYVKLPQAAGQKLERAAQRLGVPKKALVTELVTKYIDGGVAEPNRGVLGAYSFQSYEQPEVLDADQAARFLQLTEKQVVELAEAGELPGRKLGPVWRFLRNALAAWLAEPLKEKR